MVTDIYLPLCCNAIQGDSDISDILSPGSRQYLYSTGIGIQFTLNFVDKVQTILML